MFQLVSTRMTEGQHLMSAMQDVFTKAINTTPTDQQTILRDDMSALRNSWDQLSIDLNSVTAQLKVIKNTILKFNIEGLNLSFNLWFYNLI